MESLQFLPDIKPLAFSATELLEVARQLTGLPYFETTFVQWVATDAGDVAQGHLNCWGLLFVVAQKLELIDEDFWLLLQLDIARLGAAKVLYLYLKSQLVSIPVEHIQPGDVLMFRWRGDGRTWDSEGQAVQGAAHHIAIYSDIDPAPIGAMIHAVDTAADLSGGVFESEINAHDWAQLHSVWRFPQLCGLGDGLKNGLGQVSGNG